MEIDFSGGPFAGKTLSVPSPPDAIEFPLFTTNGGCMETARYERIRNSTHFEFIGKEHVKTAVEPGIQKSVVIRKVKPVKQHEHGGKAHMEWDNKKGRYVVKEEKDNGKK